MARAHRRFPIAPRRTTLAEVRRDPPFPAQVRRKLLRLLAASRWPDPRQWRELVVHIDGPDGDRVLSRAALAEELAGNDLRELAREVLERTVRPFEILVLLIADDNDRAGVHLRVVGLRGGGR